MDWAWTRRLVGRTDAVPWMTAHDAAIVAGLPAVAAVALFTDEAAWHAIARAAARHAGGILSRGPKDLIARIDEVDRRKRLAAPPAEIARALVENEIQTTFMVVRDHLPGGWRPAIRIDGEEYLKSALADGRGAVLWDSHFSFASLVTKIGLHAVGYRLHHLSRAEHGFSASRFGVRVLNPIRTSVERRYLADRLVVASDDSGAALLALGRRLQQNAVVSITVRSWAKRPVVVPFFDDRLMLAPGAPALAWKTGAALLPVFTTRDDVGRYRIVIEPAIPVPARLAAEAALAAAAREYARRLQPHVARHPGQWIEWINI